MSPCSLPFMFISLDGTEQEKSKDEKLTDRNCLYFSVLNNC